MSTDDLSLPPPTSADNARTVAREGGWAGLFNVLGAIIRYGNAIIVTRVLGAKLYGLYVLANRVVTVISVPSGLGLPTSLVHFTATYADTGQWGKLRWFIRAAFRTAVLSSAVGAVLILLLSPWASHSLFEKDGLLLPLSGLALALPFWVLYQVCAGGLQGLKAIRGKVFIERIAHPLVFSAMLLIAGFYFRSLEYVLVCFFAAAVMVFLLGLTWLRKRLAALPSPPPSPPMWGHLLSFSTPVMFMQFLNYFITWSDILVLGHFGSAANVGVYGIASTLGQGVSMPTDAMGTSLAPSFSGLAGRGEKAELRRLFHTSTRWIFLLATFAGLGLILAGPAILRLFGRDFEEGYLALCLLAVGQMISAAYGANGTLITMTGHPKVNLYNAIFLGPGNLALCLFLIPRYGLVGAAASAAFSWTILNATRAVEVWVLLRIGPWDRTILKPLAAFLAGAALGGAAFHFIHPLVGAAVGLSVYAGLWYLLRPEPEDWDMLKRAWAKLRRSPLGGRDGRR
ncbi:MAG: oligosaccharide flippase family protein [Acidobacteriota bacterium]